MSWPQALDGDELNVDVTPPLMLHGYGKPLSYDKTDTSALPQDTVMAGWASKLGAAAGLMVITRSA